MMYAAFQTPGTDGRLHCRRFKIRRYLLAIAAYVSLDVLAAANPAWQAIVAYDPLQDKSACLIESAQVIVDDGQTTTPVRFLYNGRAFLATTESNIDLTYPDIGLQVDAHPRIPIDDVYNDTNVVFARSAAQITALFISGSKARLSLGFWPTWPKGDTVVTEFSLTGFTRAHADFLQCQKTQRVERSVDMEGLP